MRIPSFALSTLLLATACEREPVIIDNYGPPAGYALVTGSVRTAAGAPVTSASVWLSSCRDPIGAHFESAMTDATGSYAMRGQLPPIGVLGRLELDTLRIRCYAWVGVGGRILDSLDVRFAREPDAPARHTLNLIVP